MAEFVHVFQAGRMNKDLDERLVPNGEYRDALNLDLANSDASDVGAMQNIAGTIQLRSKTGTGATWTGGYIDAMTNPVCIGSYRDDINERIYWFIASDGISAIAEYDQTKNEVSPVLVDTEGILNFSSDYLITGINILDKFLFWTDDQTEPKKINIEKFKTGSTNFVTQTKIPKWDADQNTYNTNLSSQPDFVEADITVIKLSPTAPPTISAFDSKRGGNGTGTNEVTTEMTLASMVNFTYIPDPANFPFDSEPLDTYGRYLANTDPDTGDPNFYQNSSIPNWNGLVTFTVNTVPNWQVNDIVELTTEFENDFFERFDFGVTVKITAVNNATITGEIQAISNDLRRYYNEAQDVIIYLWEALLVEEKPMFEYVFPRFAYRWKYIDGEYSCFSPFSKVAFLGSEFKYLSSDGYNIGMTNTIRRLFIESLMWGSEEVSELDILYKESNSTTIYVVDTLKAKDYTPYTLTSQPDSYEIENELIGATVESNQILRPWDNVPRKAKAQEIVGNRVVYGNYLQNYTLNETIDLNVSVRSNEHSSVADGTRARMPDESLKSIRTYQVGVIFKDGLGRETPVFTSDSASVQVDISNSKNKNQLLVTPLNDVPFDEATYYKFFVKENSNEYYNLALDKFYNAEDGNVWLSFPSSERNKVDEETYLILKKQHDTDVAVETLNRYKILAIENEAPSFISTFERAVGSARITLSEQLEIGYLLITFTGPSPDANPDFGPNLNGNKIQLSIGTTTTDTYQINTVKVLSSTSYEVTLERPLGADAGFVTGVAVGGTVDMIILEDKTENKPEFEGRFFAKINRDFSFDTNIIDSFSAMEPRYGILDEIKPHPKLNSSNDPGSKTIVWGDEPNFGSPGWGCSSNNGGTRLRGWGSVGSDILTNAILQDKFPSFQPPTRNSKKFGIIAVNVGEYGYYIDPAFGNVRSVRQGDWGGSAAVPNGLMVAGQEIRFQNNSTTGEFAGVRTEPYTILYSIGAFSKRGRSQIPGANRCDPGNLSYDNRYAIYIELDREITESWFPSQGDWNTLEQNDISIEFIQKIVDGGNKLLSSNNPAIFETEPKEKIDLDLYYEASEAKPIADYNNVNQVLDWFNCYSYGTGVESNRIRDDYNAVTIDKGPKVSTVLDAPYAAERRGSGFIFSQIYNSTSGINRLNQFIQAEPITKDLNPIYGTIQKLHARDTDLISLCEDKCLRVLANKDALFNADGNSNVTSNQAVLGQAVPYAGEFGISKNPESFASYGFRVYFTDKNRGAVIRLSRDGITNIAEKGMSSFFADNLRTSTTAIGSYDDDKDIYNLTLNNLSNYWQKRLSLDADYQLDPDCKDAPDSLVPSTTISFKESVDGWTSRKSFIQESGITLNNLYYTFKSGLIWVHGANTVYNNFYGVQYDSSFNVLINEMPQVVKGFSTLNYTGTASRIFEYQGPNQKWYSIAEVNANQIIPQFSQIKKHGWYTSFVRTDLEAGMVKEFQKKEGKYFNYIKGTLIGCEPDGNGIGPCLDCGDDTPQDYLLTVTIDETCSSSGSPTPDTDFEGWYQWNSKGKTSSILEAPTAQDAKCIIDDFYAYINGGYSSVTSINYNQFKYVFSDGISVGTQMYDKDTLQPITEAGTYLWIKPPPIGIAPDSPSLDSNNPTIVPNTYFIVIWGSDGIIDSITPYNSLAACSPPTPDMFRVFNYALKAGNSDPQIPYFNVTQGHTSTENFLCSLRSFMHSFWEQSDDPNINGPNQGWSSFDIYWSGPGEIEVGTILYIDPINLYAAIDRYLVTGPGEGVYEYYIEFDAANRWTDVSSLPNGYKLIKTNSTGVVTEITQMNQIPNPPCT